MINYKTINTEWWKGLQDDQGLNIPEDAYLNVELAYRCLRLRCNSLISIPAELQDEAGEVVDWPFQLPLKELLWFTEAAIIMRNAAFILKVTSAGGKGVPQDLLWLNPFNMTTSGLVTGPLPRVANINLTLSSQQFHYASDVFSGKWVNTVESRPMIYIRDFNPISDIRPGKGAMEVGLASSQLRWWVLRFGSRFFEGGAMPVTLLSFADNPDPKEVKAVESRFKKIMGGVKNAFSIIGTSTSIKVHTITPDLDKLALEELINVTTDALLDTFEVPNSLVRDVSNQDLATTQRRSFFEDIIGPRSEMIAGKLNRELFKDMGLKLVFNLQKMSMFQVDETNRVNSLSTLVSGLNLSRRLGMEILGFSLTDPQWEEVDAIDSKPEPEPEPAPNPFEKPELLEAVNEDKDEDTKRKKAKIVKEEMYRWQFKRLKSNYPVTFNTDHLNDTDHAKIMTATGLCFSNYEVVALFSDLKAVLGERETATDERMEDEDEFTPLMLLALEEQVKRIEESIDPSGFLSSPTGSAFGPTQAPIDPPNDEFWEKEDAILAAFLVTFIAQWLESSIAESAVLLGEVALSIGPEVNASAAKFAEKHALALARGLNKTTRELTKRRVAQFIISDQPFGNLVDTLLKSIAPKWRAQMISQTEVTRAYAEGKNQVADGTEGVKGAIWITLKDERVCFPKWTLVKTKRGNVPIQSVTTNDTVLTRKGWQKVKATRAKPYNGPMTELKTDNNILYATSDHPVWNSKKGWLEIGLFNESDGVETFNDKILKVNSIVNFNLSNSYNRPALPVEVFGFSGISGRVLMPVSAVYFDNSPVIGQGKINGISSNAGFLMESNRNIPKSQPYSLFNAGLSVESTITGQRAKSPIVRWGSSKLDLAIFTGNNKGWATALLRAIMSIKALFGPKLFSTPFAVNILSIGKPTSPTAYSISMLNRFMNNKRLTAFGAGLSDNFNFSKSFFALHRAILFASIDPSSIQIKRLLASNTYKSFATLGRIMVALVATIKPFATTSGTKAHFTLFADIHKRASQLLIRLEILYHRLSGKAITVYDIQVENVPEFYANEILVHNCPLCGPLEGRRIDDIGFSPPRHPGCRCEEGFEIDE